MTDRNQPNLEPPHRVLVAQIGARMHYAVPRIFHEDGILAALHTDICAAKGWPRLCSSIVPRAIRTPAMKRLFGRIPHGIPTSLIRTENDLGLKFAVRLQRARSSTEQTAIHLEIAEQFCRRVVDRGIDAFDCVYVFTSDGLEILEETRRRRIPSIVEQTIPPREIVVEMYKRERERYPDLVGEESLDGRWQDLAEREKREWDLADVIFCGSQFVLDGIREVNGPVEKSIVVNYGVDVIPPRPQRKPVSTNGPTNVLFVGEVGFRKGAHYLIEAARKLPKDFRFRFCGKVVLPEKILESVPDNVEILGVVPRHEIPGQYHWADLFCLPSLLEGSATVTYEAMAAGLPIVTTPTSGSLVRDGIDGYIVPPRDVDALVAALERCRLAELPHDRVPPCDHDGGPPTYTFEAYKDRLLKAVRETATKHSGAVKV